jgi:hypothetical protein
MLADLDRHGSWAYKPDGTMVLNDFMVLRSCILRQANRAFMPTHKRNRDLRLQAYKDKNDVKYGELIRTNDFEFQKIQKDLKDVACKHIGFAEKAYNKTILDLTENQELMTVCQMRESDVRILVHTQMDMPANADLFNRNSLTKIAVELTQEEFKHHKRHFSLRFSVG